MSASSDRAREFYAKTYDASVGDWEGEIVFYRSLTEETVSKGQAVLEIACGTGRVAIRLADYGGRIVGLDISKPMLEVARSKSRELQNIEWIEADMRSFDLGETFGLILIPGHAFQNLVEPSDQVDCLESIARHLDQDGILVVHLDHQNFSWLGDLVREKGGVFEKAEEFVHPESGLPVQASRAWSYEPSNQTAIAETIWEEFDGSGNVVKRWESGPIRLHCVFRFEMEHLFALTGFDVIALHGDFLGGQLTDTSGQMIWVAKKRNV